MRVESAFLRARCALAVAAEGRDRRQMRSVAARDAARIEREDMPWSAPMAKFVRAALAYLDGDVSEAATGLADAADAFDRADMQLYAAVVRRRLGAVVGGERGRTLQRDADSWMSEQAIRNPAALTRMLAPGFPD